MASHSDDALLADHRIRRSGGLDLLGSCSTEGDQDDKNQELLHGEYSHTVRKPALLEADQTPAEAASFPGGLRVVEIDQTILEFSHEVIAVAERVTGERLIQARVDVVLDDAGQPMLMEL